MEEIKKAIKEDILEIVRIMESAGDATERGWYIADDLAFIERHIEKEGYILKYMTDGTTAGFLIVRRPMLAEDNLGRTLENWSEGLLTKVSHMESAAVLPEFRGQKIQKKLLEEAEKIERKQGMQYLMCTVHPENRYSVENLEQLGYMVLLETEKYGGLRRKIVYKKLDEAR